MQVALIDKGREQQCPSSWMESRRLSIAEGQPDWASNTYMGDQRSATAPISPDSTPAHTC